MGYGDLSYTEMIISHEAKLSGIYETSVRDKCPIPWLVIGQVFYPIERQFQTIKDVKEPGHRIREFIQ